jgi:ferredoxin-NADP reductase
MIPTNKPETRNPKPETVSKAVPLLMITPQTPEISTLRFDDLSLKFKPGQSIAITFPGEPKKRHYSISSSPTEGPYIEITVKGEKGSALATALAHLKRGDVLEIEGPFGGSLSLPDPVKDSLAFIAAGTGITPFRSMIRFLIDSSVPTEYYLLHSVRSQRELLFHDEFRNWSGKNKNFHYIPTITQDFDNNWIHETGRIGEVLIRKHVTASPCTYLLCGPTAFVNDMEKLLKDNLKFPQDRIRREKW